MERIINITCKIAYEIHRDITNSFLAELIVIYFYGRHNSIQTDIDVLRLVILKYKSSYHLDDMDRNFTKRRNDKKSNNNNNSETKLFAMIINIQLRRYKRENI